MDDAIIDKMSVGDIVVKYPQTRKILEQFGIDYCCGGKQQLKTAVAAIGLNQEKVLEALFETIDRPDFSEEERKDWSSVSVSELADHIEKTHHVFVKKQLPRLSNLLDKVINAHKTRHGEMLKSLQEAFCGLKADIEMHLPKEEQILFPYIRQIEAYVEKRGIVPEIHCGSIQNPIQQMEYEHDQLGDILLQIRKITSNFHLPEDACNTFRALYDGLKDLEDDLHEHIHLENNILFPRAVKLEEQLIP